MGGSRMTDVAAELRARAEKARADARELPVEATIPNRLRLRTRAETGSFTAYLNGGLGAFAEGIQTAPNVASMYVRLGFYPADVPGEKLEMKVRNVKVYERSEG